MTVVPNEPETDERAPRQASLRMASAALIVNALLNIVESSAGLPSIPGVIASSVLDLGLGFALLRGQGASEPARRIAVVRVALGLLLVAGGHIARGDALSATHQLAFSGALLLLLSRGPTRRGFVRGAAGLVALTQALRVVIFIGMMQGFLLLQPWIERGKFEPHTVTLQGRTQPYRLALPAGWQPLREARRAADAPDADRIVARLVRGAFVTIVAQPFEVEQRFLAARALDSALQSAERTARGFALVRRGTLGAPLGTPFIEYQVSGDEQGAGPMRAIVTVVGSTSGAFFTIAGMFPAEGRGGVRDEVLRVMQGFEAQREAPSAVPASLAARYQLVPSEGISGRAARYRLRPEGVWFAKRAASTGEGLDLEMVVPYEDVSLATRTFAVTPAIDLAGTVRQSVGRLSTGVAPTVEALPLPPLVTGALARFTTTVDGDPRTGFAGIFVRDDRAVLVISSAPTASAARFSAALERTVRSLAFE